MGIRIKPATALSAILAVAFALELLAVLSVPVTRSITLCTYQNIQFGVFGYCDTSTNTCSKIGIGYGDVTAVEGFSLPSNARHTLANLLIVHVVTAGLTFILFVLTLFAHFHTFANSSRYLLFILILTLPCFMLSLLAFLVDILLFVPHLDWGGWIVLAATVLIVFFGILLCIMRRTMSSRKAMKRHHNESAELHNLNNFNSSSHFMPDGGMVYGGENVRKYANTDYNEVAYTTTTHRRPTNENDDSIPLNSRFQENVYESNHSNISGDLDPSFYPAGTDFNQYDNVRNQTPSPSRDYRTPEYSDYSEYRGTSGWSATAGNNYRSGSNPRAPSAVEAAAATVGTVGGTTVAVSQGPGRIARSHGSVSESIIPAGTYEYDDGASVAPDSYSEFGGNVIPVPKIQNPSAVPQQRSYSTQVENQAMPPPAGSSQPYVGPRQRTIPAPQTAQAGYFPDKQTLPTAYESAAESAPERAYEQPQPAWRNQAAPPSQSPQHSRTTPDQYQQQPPSRGTPIQDIRQMYVNEPDDDQFYAPPTLDSSHLHTVVPKPSNPSIDVPTSPAISETSNFTSISQRPINPKYYQQPASSRKAASDRTDFVLANNPDFQLPGGKNNAKRTKPPVIAAQPLVSPGPRANPGASTTLEDPLGTGSNDGPYGASRGL